MDIVAHITFIQVRGERRPWHVSFTKTTHPFVTLVLGQDPRNLSFTYDDFRYNSTVDNFPRSPEVRIDGLAEDIDEAMMVFFMREQENAPGRTLICAIDQDTFDYLRRVFPCGILRLLEYRRLASSEVITVGYAYGHHMLNAYSPPTDDEEEEEEPGEPPAEQPM